MSWKPDRGKMKNNLTEEEQSFIEARKAYRIKEKRKRDVSYDQRRGIK